jgi:hypothetical protein
MEKASPVNKAYSQCVILKGRWRERALNWPNAEKTLAIHVPISDPDTLTILSFGQYFEPFIRGLEVFCLCLAPVDMAENTAEKEKDLYPLVEYLRQGDA